MDRPEAETVLLNSSHGSLELMEAPMPDTLRACQAVTPSDLFGICDSSGGIVHTSLRCSAARIARVSDSIGRKPGELAAFCLNGITARQDTPLSRRLAVAGPADTPECQAQHGGGRAARGRVRWGHALARELHNTASLRRRRSLPKSR